jgi:RimJ/RimL family protein N-acetyltransferase
VFTPITTARLTIRPFTPDDTAAFAARRSDPEVARYQNWTAPYPVETAEGIVTELVAMDGPEKGEWWMAIVADRTSGQVFGDLAFHLSEDGNTAEVGYSFAPEHWGHGYAVEALDALIDHAFDTLGVTRIFGMLHPDNPASAMVMERCGFVFEGHTRSSFWLDGEVSDDWIYGLLREDRQKWRDRPRHQPDVVELVPITHENERDVHRLRTHKTQEEFVATVANSYVDYLFPYDAENDIHLVPWMRAIKADGEYVGFVMLALISEENPEPYLWRLLIDRHHQRRGISSRVLAMIEDECRAMGGTSVLTSWVEGKGSPAPFYMKHGFVPTGNIVDDETEARKTLD